MRINLRQFALEWSSELVTSIVVARKTDISLIDVLEDDRAGLRFEACFTERIAPVLRPDRSTHNVLRFFFLFLIVSSIIRGAERRFPNNIPSIWKTYAIYCFKQQIICFEKLYLCGVYLVNIFTNGTWKILRYWFWHVRFFSTKSNLPETEFMEFMELFRMSGLFLSCLLFINAKTISDKVKFHGNRIMFNSWQSIHVI